ncbi:PREDICTED: uncharacterized protein LOC104743453 [Camelina sativa]|uniref:Uncharacterized protein LOC104743453 n=1 Tax=Camelina sativa TaxID=90675 RepID=A0ABM0VY15_CAMSA|nr:PREDICTED: uncharacterized protein LOC104743453 [Camelina sativa]
MDFHGETVSLNHQIDRNPKPEDAGRIKVYVSILMSEYPIRDCRPILAFSLPAREFQDSFTGYRWEQLNCLEDDERLSISQVDFARTELSRLVTDVMFYSVKYSPYCALSIYITFKFNDKPPAMVEEYKSLMEDTTTTKYEEYKHLPVDESVMRIQEPNWNVFHF